MNRFQRHLGNTLQKIVKLPNSGRMTSRTTPPKTSKSVNDEPFPLRVAVLMLWMMGRPNEIRPFDESRKDH
jgi:hypothetical protein